MSKVFLCDGHNLAFRAFYGIRELNRSDGFPTNMIHGWLRSFWRLEDDFKPDDIWVFLTLVVALNERKFYLSINPIGEVLLKVLLNNWNGLKSFPHGSWLWNW